MNPRAVLDPLAAQQGRVSVAWLVLAIASQFATQRLIVAGPYVRFQHFVGPADMVTQERLPFLAIVILQLVLVGIGTRQLWHLGGSVRGALPGWRIWPVAILFTLSAAAMSRSVPGMVFEFAFASLVQLVALFNVAIVVATLPQGAIDWIDRQAEKLSTPAESSDGTSTRLDSFVVLLSIAVVAVTALLCIFSYERHPHIPDEVPYIFHARYFAAGKLFLPPPPIPEAFDINLVSLTASKWYSPVPPGWPAVLAIGARLGIPWMINPMLAGVNVLLASLLLRQLYPPRTARLAVLLLCVSPWYLFMGMNFMTHMSSLTAALVAAVACGRYMSSGNLRWTLLSGAFLGALTLIRPLEGLIVAVLLAMWVTVGRTRSPGQRLLALVVLGAGSMVVAALVLPYNHALVGNAFRFPLNTYVDANYPPGSNDMGFGANRGLGWPGLDPFPGHGAIDVIVNAVFNVSLINVELLGWATGSILVLSAVAFAPRLSRSDRMMLVSIATVAAFHSFYWFSGGPDFGARYWFLAIIPSVALIARAPDVLTTTRRPGENATWAIDTTSGRVLAGMLALSFMALLTFVPWRAIDKYRGYRGMRPDMRSVARSAEFANTLVLIRGKRHPDYASAAVYNPLDLSSNAPIFAWARSPELERKVTAYFPRRRVVVVDGPSITGQGFRIVQPATPPSPGTTR